MNGKPTGIALTACCYNVFIPQKNYVYNPSTFKWNFQYNDLRALHNVVSGIINMFTWNGKISINLPVQPYNNLFEKMSDIQMLLMKTKLMALQKALVSASNEDYVLDACDILKKVFGDDFPTL